MDQATSHTALKALIASLLQDLREASSIANAANECADAGDIDRGINLAMDCADLARQAVEKLQCLLIVRRMAPHGEHFSV